MKLLRFITLFALAVVALLAAAPGRVLAHCDTMNGPVVKAGQKALDSGNIRYALVWIKEKDEAQLRAAFDHARQVRTLSPRAKELADRYFFETLVRVHRAGEGAPYTGLKDAAEVEPGIAAAEEALENGSEGELVEHLNRQVSAGVKEKFQSVVLQKPGSPTDVEAGRRYVEAYVTYIHYIERLHQAVAPAQESHGTSEHNH